MNYYDSAFDEAARTVGDIVFRVRSGGLSYSSFAVLYRTNAQSRLFEEKLVYSNIPYRIVGAVHFYERKEIKDIMAYLKTIDNGADDIAVKRIINIPKRGIGAASIERLSEYAAQHDLSFYDACLKEEAVSALGRTAFKVHGFTTFIRKLRMLAQKMPVAELIKTILEQTGYQKELEQDPSNESADRLENLQELINKARVFDDEGTGGLREFLQETALVADIDSVNEQSDGILLMTVHSAKGLEFDHVYLVGLEEGIFPGFPTLTAGMSEIEEERRLFYVAVTRAKKTLTMSMARTRMIRGETEGHKVSRFVNELPEEVVSFCGRNPADILHRGKTDRPQGSGSSAGNPVPFSERFGASGITGRRASGSAFRGSPENAENYRKSFDPADFKIEKFGHLEYGVGDRVRHVKFGDGTVTAIVDGKMDYEVTVDFEKYGTRKLFAAFARLKKLQQ